MKNTQIEIYKTNLQKLSFEANMDYVCKNIFSVLSEKKSVFYVLSNEEGVLEFSNYVFNLLVLNEQHIKDIDRDTVNLLFYLSSHTNNIDLYNILLNYHADNGLGHLSLYLNPKIEMDERERMVEMFTLSKWVGDSRLEPDKESLDFDFTILLAKGLLSIYSVKHNFDPEFKYPNEYYDDEYNARTMLGRGRGKSKDKRRKLYFQLHKMDKYSDLEACIDNQLVYLYSKKNEEVIFTTNMDYERYLEIMLYHKATRISMCFKDYLWNYEGDYTANLTDEQANEAFINMRVIDFSDKLINFLQKEKAIGVKEDILQDSIFKIMGY